jgi:hypothetical protein
VLSRGHSVADDDTTQFEDWDRIPMVRLASSRRCQVRNYRGSQAYVMLLLFLRDRMYLCRVYDVDIHCSTDISGFHEENCDVNKNLFFEFLQSNTKVILISFHELYLCLGKLSYWAFYVR